MENKMIKRNSPKQEITSKQGRPHKFETPEEFWDKWCEYIQSLDKNIDIPRIRAFCLYADIDKDTFSEYKKREGFSVPCNKMLLICESALERSLYDPNRKNVNGIAFGLKNNFQWRDKQEIETSVSVDYASVLNAARQRANLLDSGD
jgi:hypothetical protein